VRQWGKPRPNVLDLRHRLDNKGEYNQHGRCREIPPEHRHKPILTTVRNPYDRYVSQYEFKWWQREGPRYWGDTLHKIQEAYPHYPNLTFEEFVRMGNRFLVHNPTLSLPSEDQLGRQSEQFAQFYFKKPECFADIDAAYLEAKGYWDDLVENLYFLRTDNLNADLYKFLGKMGYAPEETDFILGAKKIFPKLGGRSEDQKWNEYYTPELKAWVRHRERMLFQMFPEFDV
jgi:hypothetical protein